MMAFGIVNKSVVMKVLNEKLKKEAAERKKGAYWQFIINSRNINQEGGGSSCKYFRNAFPRIVAILRGLILIGESPKQL